MTDRTYSNVSYGPHERNVMDLYLAKSDTPTPIYVFVHGGGFRSGDKSNIPQELLGEFLQAGISVAAINYRLSGTDPYPAAMEDCVRALQTLRYRAREWNLDPNRVAAGGGSAGGGITFWIGFRPDLADSQSVDPVRRQSTRLTCIASWNTQTSYDPNFIRTIIAGPAYAHPALQEFFRVTLEEFDTPRAKKMFVEASAMNYVSKDSPPVFLWYSTPNLPMTRDLTMNQGIHHPRFGEILKEKMDKMGVECVLRLREDLLDLQPEDMRTSFFHELVDFLKRHLGTKVSS